MNLRSDVAFTPAVKAAQAERGSRAGYERALTRGDWPDRLTRELRAFIAERDSFYLGTASAEGQPYIQHRGGPKGLLVPLDDRHLGFAEFRGNRQYISLGNLSENDQAFIFLMDYAARRRVKLWGRARFIENDEVLLQKLSHPDYPGVVERALVFEIHAWDINCPQHITPRC